MRIEAKVEGLTKAKRAKLSGLSEFNEKTNLAVFEWNAAEGAPHDYPTAYDRVRTNVAAAGGTASDFRQLG